MTINFLFHFDFWYADNDMLLNSAASTRLFCSALPLGRGLFHRFKRLVWASLRLSERSRTIEVRVTTLSPQTCTKSLA